MQFDPTTATMTVAAVVLAVERGTALVKLGREMFGGGGGEKTSCAVDHEKMCTVLERVADVQEKTVEILHEQGTVLEVLKLMVDQQGLRARSLSPHTVELIAELIQRRDKMSLAREQMSDPPPRDRNKGVNR